jgi:murein L,D-transpeptidase YcbB/YkuD
MPTMYDSETPSAIPADAEIVAGYVDGQWPDFDELVTRFPNAKHVSITVSGRAGAMVGDCEKGDMTPATLATWAEREIAADRRPTLYYSKDSAPAVVAALQEAGVALTAVDYWVADWKVPAEAHLVPGSVATQWASPGTGSGGNYDVSETVEAWPAVAVEPEPEPEPAPPPAPAPPVPPAPAPSPEPIGEFMPPTVQEGDLSPAVRSAQTLLNLHAAGLTVDGNFGPQTARAVSNFQTIFKLEVDGVVGPQTWTALITFG